MARGGMAGAFSSVTFVGVLCLILVTVSCASDTGDSRDGRAGPDQTARESGDGRSDPEPDEAKTTTEDTAPDRGEHRTGPEPEVPEKYADLLRKAAEQESVRVIVTMRLNSSPGQQQAFRQAVAETANELFSELSEFDVKKGHVYRNLPMFAAEVDEPALRHLVRSDRVVRISEDTLEKPE